MNKRILGGIMAAGLAFSAFSASAAGLGVSAEPLQVGQTFDLACDDNGVNVLVHFPEHDSNPGNNSNGVTVSDIASECDGSWLTVKAQDADGNDLERVVTQLSLSGGNTASMTWDLDPEPIEGIEVHING